jgi:predicted AAA+ superfamily ATPase
LTAQELGKDFDLEVVTHWGALPKVISLTTHDERRLFLESYVDTYLREEVLVEQLVRNIVPFRKFLELAAQCSGTVVNVSNIASDLGVDPKTARSYFDILEDTLLGFTVPALERSIRKQQIKNPKFYFFDIGVKHALDGTLWKKQLTSQEFGIAFEHFIMNELFRLNSYYRSHFKFSYLRTKGGLEIDIVAEHPDHPLTFIEVKATEDVRPQHLEHLALLKRDFPEARALCICREPRARLAQGIEILPWQIGLDTLFKASYAPANS